MTILLRILFWILVAVGLGIVIYITKHPKALTSEENALFWDFIVTGVLLIMDAWILFMLIYGWIKKIAVIGSSMGKTKAFHRDSQPFGYWNVMLFYIVGFVIVSSLVCFVVKLLLVSYSKVMSNH